MRTFFENERFLETLTPPMVDNPGMEVHIHPFRIMSARSQQPMSLYLHTSPEFRMKELLSQFESEDLKQIYQICYVFRDEPTSPIHRQQFLMLEWYRIRKEYEAIQEDIKHLIQHLAKEGFVHPHLNGQTIHKKTMRGLFLEILNLDLINYQTSHDLTKKIKSDYPDVPIPHGPLSYDDAFFLLFLNKVEPYLKDYHFLILDEFPSPLAALAEIKTEEPSFAKRFEFYIEGTEIGNCFQELTNFQEQQERFKNQHQEKVDTYGYQLPHPKRFLESLEAGLPPCSGIAIGVERLLMSLLKKDNFFFD